jgi:D-aminopeptidase
MSPDARKLLDSFRSLSRERKAALLEFAAYLADKEGASREEQVSQTPLSIPRPENESVIKAVRRLRETYPMLDQNKIFSDVSSQMTRHVMQGIPAVEIIDELEVIFRRHYQTHGGDDTSSAIEDSSSS